MHTRPLTSTSVTDLGRLVAILSLSWTTISCSEVPEPPEVEVVDVADDSEDGEEEDGHAGHGHGSHGASNLDELELSDLIAEAPEDDSVLWKVNDATILASSHDYLVQLLQEQIEGSSLPDADKQEMLTTLPDDARNRLIKMELMAQAARTDGLAEDADTQKMLSMLEEDILPQALIESYLNNAVSDIDLEGLYTTHMVEYRFDTLELRIILLTDEAEAQTVQTALTAGTDFEELAAIHNTDPNLKRTGGNPLGEGESIEFSALPPNIQTELADLQTGATTAPFEEAPGQGWILVHIKERSTGIHPLEDVKGKLISKAKADALDSLVHDLMAGADIVQGDQTAPENAGTLPEGETVGMWIDGVPYSQEYFTERIAPRAEQEQAAFQQQIMGQLAQVPADQQGAFMEYMQQQWASRSAQIQAELMQDLVLRIILTDKAKSIGFDKNNPRLEMMKQVMENEVLSSVYFSNYMTLQQEAGGDMGADMMTLRDELEDGLWTAASIVDTEGVAIPAPER